MVNFSLHIIHTMKHNNTAKKMVIGGVLALALVAGGLTVSANPVSTSNWNSIQSAIQNKDLNAFRSATIQAATERANSVTQEQLNTMADKLSDRQAVKDAINANDYEAFKKVAGEKMLERVNTQEEFNQLVTRNNERKAAMTQVDEAVKNNDFNAYKTALTNLKESRPEGMRGGDRGERRTPTDAQLQARFDELVAQYKADGTLPSDKPFGMGMKGMMGRSAKNL